MGSGSSMMAATKTMTVDGQNFSFTPKEMTVKKGDTVKIVFNDKTGMHNFIIDEFDVKTKTLKTGQSDTVTFVADKAGKFQYYCGIGNHRAMGMWGTLTVQ